MQSFGVKTALYHLSQLALSGFTQKVHAQSDSTPSSSNTDSIPNAWKDLVINGPCTYSKLGKPFDNVLFSFKMNSYKVVKNLDFDDGELRLENTGNIGKNDVPKLHINGKLNIGKWSPYFKMGEDITVVGMSMELCKYYMNNTGFRQRFIPDVELKSSETVTDATINTAVGRVHRTVYSHSQFRHRPGILDVNLELSEDQSRTAGHVRLGTNVSAVCGRRFGNVGLLAGFDLTIDNVKHVDWNCCRQTVSMAVALPTWAMRFTLYPNTNLCSFHYYWKINESLEMASRFMTKWKSPAWLGVNNEIGFKYLSSDDITYGLKFNGAGIITLATWLKTNHFNLSLFGQLNLKSQHSGQTGKMGVSVEF